MDRKFAMTGLAYALVGLALGIYMAASNNHGQLVTHAHIMLLGFVVSFVYGLCHRLWLGNDTSRTAVIQYYVHQFGSAFLFIGLFLLYGGFLEAEVLEPVLALASMVVFVGMLLMVILFVRAPENA